MQQLPRLSWIRGETHEEITEFTLVGMNSLLEFLEIRIKVLSSGRGNLNVSPKEPPRPV